jgi:hypothetical protein
MAAADNQAGENKAMTIRSRAFRVALCISLGVGVVAITSGGLDLKHALEGVASQQVESLAAQYACDRFADSSAGRNGVRLLCRTSVGHRWIRLSSEQRALAEADMTALPKAAAPTSG